MTMFLTSKKVILTALFLWVTLYGASAVAADLQPKTTFIPVIPRSSTVASYNTDSFVRTVNGLISNGYNVDVYGGTFNSAGYLTSVQTVPFSYNSDSAFNYVNSAVQSTDASKFIIYGGGHGSPGAAGSTEAFGQGSTFATKLQGLDVQEGQAGSVWDQSCYSADRCGMTNLFTEGGPIESYTGASLPGSVASSDALRDVMAHQPLAGDINGDGVMSASELNSIDYTATHRFDGGGSTTIGTKTATKDGKDPELFFKKDYKARQAGSVTVATKYKWVGPLLGEFCEGKEYMDTGTTYVLKGTPLSDAKQCELAQNIHKGVGNAVALGDVPLVGAGQYGESPFCQENRPPGNPKKIGLSAPNEGGFTVDCKEPAPFKPSATPPGGGQSNPFGGSPGAPPGGAAPAPSGGLGALLPALMKALLGQGGQSQQGQNPYGAGLGTAQQSCALQGLSPVCGADGKTYNNPCYLAQSQTVQVSTGVCSVSLSNSSAGNVSDVINRLSGSGVPVTLVGVLKDTVATIFSSLFSGSQVGETVIK